MLIIALLVKKCLLEVLFFLSNFNLNSPFFPAFLRTDISSRVMVKKINNSLTINYCFKFWHIFSVCLWLFYYDTMILRYYDTIMILLLFYYDTITIDTIIDTIILFYYDTMVILL